MPLSQVESGVGRRRPPPCGPQMDAGKVPAGWNLGLPRVFSVWPASGFEVSSSWTTWALYRVFQSLQLFSCALFKTAFSSWCKKPPWAACGLQEELQKAARAAWVALGRATHLFAGRPWAGWLQRQTLVFSQFWRPEARGLGASRLDFFRGCFPRLVDGHLLHVASRGVFPARLGVPWCPSPS